MLSEDIIETLQFHYCEFQNEKYCNFLSKLKNWITFKITCAQGFFETFEALNISGCDKLFEFLIDKTVIKYSSFINDGCYNSMQNFLLRQKNLCHLSLNYDLEISEYFFESLFIKSWTFTRLI